MSKQVLGKAIVRVNGQALETRTGAVLNLGGTPREAIAAGGSIYYAEMEKVPATLEATLVLRPGDDLSGVREISGATITFIADTGQTFMVRDAFSTEVLSVTEGQGGQVPLRMAGEPAELV